MKDKELLAQDINWWADIGFASPLQLKLPVYNVHWRLKGLNIHYAVVLMDCVIVNHSKAVVNVFNKNGIVVYPSNGANKPGGMTPYSCDISIMDGSFFPNAQWKLQ